jgi:hypothetical protein
MTLSNTPHNDINEPTFEEMDLSPKDIETATIQSHRR